MSLICGERRRDIEFGDPLMAGTRKGLTFYTALSQEALSRIPRHRRLRVPRKAEGGGADIHYATSTRNFNGSYTLCDFTLGAFCYAISEDTLKRFLPRFAKISQELPRHLRRDYTPRRVRA
jgi:hypothetical protein